MNKKTIIKTLEKIATYLELKGENPFKVSAFRKAANALEQDERSLNEIEDFTKIKGIGKGTAQVINELHETGESTVLHELEQSIPAGLIPLLQLPGLGGKKLSKLYAELGICDAESLKEACLAKKVQALAGFGAKTEEKILKELEEFGKLPDRLPYWRLEKVVEEIEKTLQSIKEIHRFSVAGSFRRVKETSKDLDFVISTSQFETVKEQLMKLPIKEVVNFGDTKVSVILNNDVPVSVDFRLVTGEEFITTLHHFTGSKDHNVVMRQIAKEQGKKISEYGVLQEDGTVKTFNSEAEFFEHFGLPFIPPSLREDGTEVNRLKEMESLISINDIVSDLHMHTTWSDGAHSVEEMQKALIGRNYQYAVITDHSQFLKVANGLTKERLEKQRIEIDQLNEQSEGFRLFAGTEMDILPDGSLDFDDDVLKNLDFVIASIHSSFSQPQEKIMERLYNAITNPYVHMIAHPTGRIIGGRGGYNPNVEQLIKWAKEYGKILELNANPYRLDLCIEHLKLAMEHNVPIAINTDAHSTEQLKYMDIGVKYAQKAWIKKELIVNTWSLEQFKQFIRKYK